MTPATPILKDVVLVGAGHAHVAVLRRFAMRPMPGVRLTVITREVTTPYSGMLPGFLAGQYGFDDMHIDVRRLARFAGARLYHAETTGLDPARRLVFCDGRPEVPYDLLSIDIGSTPDLAGIPGAAEHTIAVKPIGRLIARWEQLLVRVTERSEPVRIGVIGAGAAGVELAFALRHRFAPARASVTLFGAEADVLPGFSPGAIRRVRRLLAARGIEVRVAHPAVRIEPGKVHFTGAAPVDLDEILVATQAASPSWPADCGLAADARGFLRVSDRLQSISHPDVFAAGDIAAIEGHRRAKSGVMAVRAGPPLAENLRRVVAGRRLRRFVPQRRWLSLLATGDRYALGVRGDFCFEGAWVWRLKDWIDRKFMRMYSDLPDMQVTLPAVAPGVADAAGQAALAEAAMRCGGCAAKIGSSILRRVLARLEPPASDVELGLAARDDAAAFAVPDGKVLVQSADQFRAFIDDPFVFGQVAAHHALGDLYAMGARPHSALALATVPFAAAARMEDDLFQMLAGATSVLHDAGAVLIGGHSAEGAELMLGLSVNGLADPARLLRKSGLRPGDRLILTRALGTGVIFAADMRHRAQARWVEAALAGMTQPAAGAAAILAGHAATACTDVTGFGLTGHLLEMAEASGVDVALDLATVPLLDGAEALLRDGMVSSLHTENLAAAPRIAASEAVRAQARFSLLFDPQTAGGLLAGVAPEQADACLSALRRAGYAEASIIGTVLARGHAPERIQVD